jgi:hypothetical protein
MSAQIRNLRPDEDAKVAARLQEALRGLRYGSVEIVVHDGRVVQFERRERIRFDRPPDEGQQRR